ncbi:hypothetical protein GCM10025771_17360 [Niveibacterium umoris]
MLEEVLLAVLFYWPGWLVLRIVTIGRYPPARNQPHDPVFVAVIGLCAVLAAVTVWFHFWGS